MAYHFNDNVHTTVFTPREPQLQLLDEALKRNVLICMCKSKNFIALKLIQEVSHRYKNDGKRTLYIVENINTVSRQTSLLQRLTDLNIQEYKSIDSSWSRDTWANSLDKVDVFILTSLVAAHVFDKNLLSFSDLNLIIIQDCLSLLCNKSIKKLFATYKDNTDQPRILALSESIINHLEEPFELNKALNYVENVFNCKTETSSDIVSILSYCTQPKEYFIEYAGRNRTVLDDIIEKEILTVLEFLQDHRYNPSELYDDFEDDNDFLEELKSLPDPKEDPIRILNLFLDILHSLGPWCANQAALVFLIYVEKLKAQVGYERNYLLLCTISTVFTKIRAICDDFFCDIPEKNQIYDFSSPKVIRLLQVLKQFKPVNTYTNGIVNNHFKLCQTNNEQQLLDLNITLEQFKKSYSLIHTFFENVEFNAIEKLKYMYHLDVFECHTKNGFKLHDLNIYYILSKIQIFESYNLKHKLSKLNHHFEYQLNGNNCVNLCDSKIDYSYYVKLPYKQIIPLDLKLNYLEQTETKRNIIKTNNDVEFNSLCGLVLAKERFTVIVLQMLLNEAKLYDEDLNFITVQYIAGKCLDPLKNPKEAEDEHRKQEVVLKRFRTRECNVLVGTSVIEEGIDLPKCNLVVRFDQPENYKCYMNSKGKARAHDSVLVFLSSLDEKESFLNNLYKYHQVEKMLLEKCSRTMSCESEDIEADLYTSVVLPLKPLNMPDAPQVNLAQAISLVNRYCAKLPSDTFTRLTPLWNIEYENGLYVCTIRLPINSPIKQEIKGCPMPTKALACRFAAFQCCHILHSSHELDDSLQPIGKESFWQSQEEQIPDEAADLIPHDVRPGTTKRRQYYYKKIAESLTDCRPLNSGESYLYEISMVLTCPLPDEQNTRGRKIYAPEHSSQGFGILINKNIPKIGPFPIFTRSGEVQIKIIKTKNVVTLTNAQIDKIITFIQYTFTSVLRLQKYLMTFDPSASENSYFIVPTKKEVKTDQVTVDWDFLDVINCRKDDVPKNIPDECRKDFVFEKEKFDDAVVLPWYRNQDQPQYFYVAEICSNLSPQSTFPGSEYDTFEDYYFRKYDIQIQNMKQPLLDVDHTSVRLNFLTPRYVNRKGVALPTTSEEKKKAKRENLEQKQILVPELCKIHPFSASLWRKAVGLPCILHRVNSLLLADEIRQIVATEVSLGSTQLDENFDWPPLDFGWSLSKILVPAKPILVPAKPILVPAKPVTSPPVGPVIKMKEKVVEEDYGRSELEIGTWCNDMAKNCNNVLLDIFDTGMGIGLPDNVTLINNSDITSYNMGALTNGYDSSDNYKITDHNSDCSYSQDSSDDDYDYDDDLSDTSSVNCPGKLRIEFTGEYSAEAVEEEGCIASLLKEMSESEDEVKPWNEIEYPPDEITSNIVPFYNPIVSKSNITVIREDEPFTLSRIRSRIDPRMFYFNTEYKTQNSINTNVKEVTGVDIKLNQNPSNFVLSLPYTQIIKSNLKKHLSEIKAVAQLFDYSSQEDKTEPEVNHEGTCEEFSFDLQPDLNGHPGPSPNLVLQALTMSNANDGINLERLETIGDSFLKYAITTYLYCTYETVHEGKLSHLRSKQVSNFNLYKLGRRKVFGESMIATKFEPHDNWLPPCYYVPRVLERALIETGVPASHWNRADLPTIHHLTNDEICRLVHDIGEKLGYVNGNGENDCSTTPVLNFENMPCFIPYNLMTQHSIPDKSLADCVEALIGAYLIACGPRGALLFMSWLGINVLPKHELRFDKKPERSLVGSTVPVLVADQTGKKFWTQTYFGELKAPKSPLLRHVPDPEGELDSLLRGFDVFEENIRYRFRDRSYLLQAMTHASYSTNRLTDCYQRLEFLGDAVLDYLITRHLYENSRQHSPGALTDLRSALVNNTIFASLAVRHSFHKYFRHLSPGLNEVIDRFVLIQEENGNSISEEYYLIGEDECEEAEDIEAPKTLGDVFESIAGAIFLDSGMSLDAVWRVYYQIMKNEIEQFSSNVPKSPIRELFEMEPETAKFGKPEKLADGKRVRVTVEVFGKGIFKGIGRNYRIAKCTAAKCALKQLKRKGLLEKKKKNRIML